MRTLVIETATAACSVALFEHGALLAHAHEIVGRGHAERLIPMIGELPGQGRANEILVDCGPGSFTGVRVGIAAARGLGLGWKIPVHGLHSLALIAAGHWPEGIAAGHWPEGAEALAVAIQGGHGQLFVQSFQAGPMRALSDPVSLAPEDAAAAVSADTVIGSGAEALVALRGHGAALPGEPDARHAFRLPHSLRSAPAVPFYGRAPDAKPMA